jgi:hypothetical protein
MNFYQSCIQYFKKEGYEFLGEDGGLLFFKDEKEKVWGAGEDVIAEKMHKVGMWGRSPHEIHRKEEIED